MLAQNTPKAIAPIVKGKKMIHAKRFSPQWVIPILFSNEENYDPEKGGEFFRYLQFKLLVVERAEEGMGVEVVRKGGKGSSWTQGR